MDSASNNYLIEKINQLSYKSQFTNYDQAFLDSDNAKNIITYVKENFKNVNEFLEKKGTLKNYLILKIKKFIELEHNYSLEGYKNTADTELATSDITNEIKLDLEEIEEFLINPSDLPNMSYDLDENPYIESISE